MKSVELSSEIERYASFRLQVNARSVGKRLGKKTQALIAASKAGQWKRSARRPVEIEGEILEGEDFSVLLEPREGVVCQPLGSNDAIVILDLAIDAGTRARGRRARRGARRAAGAARGGPARLRSHPSRARAARRLARGRASSSAPTSPSRRSRPSSRSARPPEGGGFSSHAAEMSGESLRVALRRAR